MKAVVFRCDGSSTIGLGHVSRCLSIAKALRHLHPGLPIYFLSKNLGGRVGTWIEKSGFGVQWVPSQISGKAEASWVLKSIRSRHPQAVLVADSYRLGSDFLNAVRQGGVPVAFIDDNAIHPVPVDLLINPNVTAMALRYQTLPETVRLLGTRYALLGPAFWHRKRRTISSKPRRILISLGGGDTSVILKKILRWTNDYERSRKVALQWTVIAGPAMASLKNGTKQEFPKQIRFKKSIRNMSQLMQQSERAIVNAGTTMLESACQGLPALAISMVDNQDRVGRAWERSRAALFLTRGRQLSAARYQKALGQLLSNKTLAVRFSSRGRQLVDGQGAIRVARHLLKLTAKGN